MTTSEQKLMSPAEYAAWMCTICLTQIGRAPDESTSAGERDQMRFKIEAAQGMMSRSPVTLADCNMPLSLIDEVICYVYERRGLGTDCLSQQSFLHQLVGISKAIETQRDQPNIEYRRDGGFLDLERGSFPEEIEDHATNIGNALSTCHLCQRLFDEVLCPHIYLLEGAIKESVGSPSDGILNEMADTLEDIDFRLTKSFADLKDDDFDSCLQDARRARGCFIQLCLLDPLAAKSEGWIEFDSTLSILLENLQLAKENPTGPRPY
jgi:hypothetical protein